MSILDRWAQKAPRGRATEQFTPDQAAYRAVIPAGRGWYADPVVGTRSTMFRHHRHADGTGEMIRLDQDGDQWFQGSAKAGLDIKVGRL